MIPEGATRIVAIPRKLPSLKTSRSNKAMQRQFRHPVSALHSAETDVLHYGQALAKMRNSDPSYAMVASLYRLAQQRAAELASRTGAH